MQDGTRCSKLAYVVSRCIIVVCVQIVTTAQIARVVTIVIIVIIVCLVQCVMVVRTVSCVTNYKVKTVWHTTQLS